jgi:ABC-2 type transport system permease protein
MPTVFYVISYFIPASYYINITRGIILRRAGIAHLWTDGLAFFAIGTVLLIIAARHFQNKVIMA